jgi:hypothetical protein
MFNKLNQHLQANNVLEPEQFGFRTGIGLLLEKQFLHSLTIFLLC